MQYSGERQRRLSASHHPVGTLTSAPPNRASASVRRCPLLGRMIQGIADGGRDVVVKQAVIRNAAFLAEGDDSAGA